MVTYLETLDEAVVAWRHETLDEHEYAEAQAYDLEQAGICPHCDGFHANHTGWAGVYCIVATGIQPWHWRPDNEWED